VRDDMIRSACFASLDVLCAQFGDDVPYSGGLNRGFPFGGARVPFLNRQQGIFRAAARTGPAALAIQTSWKSPYDDEQIDDGFVYAYRAGSRDHPGYYRPIYPAYIVEDDPSTEHVIVSPGRMIGPLDERDPVLPEDPIEHLPTEGGAPARRRVHRRRPRGARRADRSQWAESLLDPPPSVRPEPRRRLGRLRGARLEAAARGRGRADAPAAQAWRPDRARLAERFERFASTAA
jgi:hypothetical protein